MAKGPIRRAMPWRPSTCVASKTSTSMRFPSVTSMAGRRDDMKNSESTEDGRAPSELIDRKIAELGDWRGATLSRMRALIKEADPNVVEEWKWMGTPVWEHGGIICTGESY